MRAIWYNGSVKFSIRVLYLYLFSAIGLVVVIFSSVRLVNLALKVFIFKEADIFEYVAPLAPDGKAQVSKDEEEAIRKRETQRQRQREASEALAGIMVGLPIYLYHWQLIKREKK